MTAYGASGSDVEPHTVDDSKCPGQQGYQQRGYQLLPLSYPEEESTGSLETAQLWYKDAEGMWHVYRRRNQRREQRDKKPRIRDKGMWQKVRHAEGADGQHGGFAAPASAPSSLVPPPSGPPSALGGMEALMTAYGASGSDSEDVEHTVDDSTCPGQQGYQQLGYQKGYQQDGPPSKPQKRTMRSKAKKMRAKLRGAP